MQAVLDKLGRRTGVGAAGFVTYEIEWARLAPLCCAWSRNRAPDAARVAAIAAHLRAGGYVPPLLHLAELSGEARPLACFDGNHRREAFAAEPLGDADADSWLGIAEADKRVVLATVMFRAEPAAVEAAFRAINAGVSVPELYVRAAGGGGPAREEILALAQSYAAAYPKFASPSAQCAAPNFNRDLFADNLDSLCRALGTSAADVAAALPRLNAELAAGRGLLRPLDQYSAGALKKCRTGAFWLFIDGRTVSASAIAPLLRNAAGP